MRNHVFPLWIALLGATRVDLLQGGGPFVLTPFLTLSPLLLLMEGHRLVRRADPLPLPRSALVWSLALGALAVLLILSTFFALDPEWASRRVALLLVQLAFTTLLGIALFTGPHPERILVRGAYLGLGIALVLSVGQLLAWAVPAIPHTLLGGTISLESYGYGGILPRPSGLAHDPNLGGLTFLFLLAILALFAPPSPLRTAAFVAGGVAVVATLSRSAMLAGGILVMATLLHPDRLRVTPRAAGALAALAALFTGMALLLPGFVDPVMEVGAVLTGRFSADEGSAGMHLLLLGRGWEVASESLATFFLGIGYGNAFLVVQDFFPGNEYGNFHSLYLTFLAEAGILSALLVVGVLGVAWWRGGPWRPLIVAFAVFNFFQQSHTEPWFWMVLLAAWMRVTPTPPPAAPANPTASAGGRRVAPILLLALLAATGCDEVLTDPFEYGVVEVETVRRSGDPVPGVALTLFSGTRHLGYALSAEGGPTRFEFVPAGSIGVTAFADPELYRPVNLGTGYVRTFSMAEGDQHTLTFTYLKFGPGRIEVRVTDPSGQGIEGVPIQVYNPEGVYADGATDSPGTFSVENVPFGPYGVRAIQGRGYTVPGVVAVRDGLFVEDGITEEATFQFQRCLATLIVSARTPGGEPVEGIPFALYDPSQVWEEGDTGSDGTLPFRDIPCANYGVRLTSFTGVGSVTPPGGFVDGLSLEHGETRQVAFTVEPCRADLRVHVRDPEGAPVPGAQVLLYIGEGPIETREVSGDGTVEWSSIPCRDAYGVRVLPPPQWRTTGEGPGESYFDGIRLAEDGSSREFTFTLVRE